MQIESIALTNVGLVRSMNQDSIYEIPQHGVFLVADGMGGEKAGEEASAQVVETIKAKFGKFFEKEPTGPSQIEGEMRDGLLSANRDVFQISVREPDKRGLGSTASLLCLHRGVYFAAQVGDSRIYLKRDGHVQQITRDHTLVWALYEQGAITREQLETHPDRHLLTQCIGNERPVKVDTFMGQIQEGDIFLLCSDGLTGYAKEPKVFEIIQMDELPLQQRGEMMIQAALDAGGGDNVSVVMAQIVKLEATDDWEPEATAPPARFNADDTEHAFATSMHHQIIEPEPEVKKQPPWLGWTGVLLGVIGLIGIFVYIGSDHTGGRVKVYLGSSQAAPANLEVQLSKGGQALPRQNLQSDSEGNYFVLPGPGNYQLQFASQGYIAPDPLTLNPKPGELVLRLRPTNWTKQSILYLKMPPDLAIRQIKLLDESGNGKDIVYEKEEIAKANGQLAVVVNPDNNYTVVAVAESGQKKDYPPLQVGAQQSRTFEIASKDFPQQP